MKSSAHLVQGLLVAIGLGLCAGAPAEAALVNHWDFEEADGQPAPQVLDGEGGNHGTFANMSDSDRSSDVPAGIASTRSLSFDGAQSQYVSLTSQITLTAGTDWTVAVWYRGTEVGDTSGGNLFGASLIGSDSGARGSGLAIADGKAMFYWYDHGVSNYQFGASSTSINDDQWHHVAIVQDGAGALTLYVDGVSEMSAAANISGTYPYLIDYMMYTSDYTIAAPTYTSGTLDDVRVYDHALSASEVQGLLAVPEPASLGLMLIAGGVMAIRRRSTR